MIYFVCDIHFSNRLYLTWPLILTVNVITWYSATHATESNFDVNKLWKRLNQFNKKSYTMSLLTILHWRLAKGLSWNTTTCKQLKLSNTLLPSSWDWYIQSKWYHKISNCKCYVNDSSSLHHPVKEWCWVNDDIFGKNATKSQIRKRWLYYSKELHNAFYNMICQKLYLIEEIYTICFIFITQIFLQCFLSKAHSITSALYCIISQT